MRHSGEVKNSAHFRKEVRSKWVIAYLNINSIRKKFELLPEKTKGNLDILLLSETKFGERFSDSQFKMDGFNNAYRVTVRFL